MASFNILHGRSPADGVVDLDRLRAAIAELDADVLGLQEVDRDQPRSHLADLTAEAASALGGTGRFAAAIMGTPGEAWRPATDDDGPGAAYGIGLVTRLPVQRWQVVRLASAPVRSPVVVPGRVLWLRDEPRVLLAAVLDSPYGPMTVATTHLSFVPGWNAGQLRKVVRVLRTLPAPRILLGDLNLPGPVARWLSGWTPLAAAPTYPAPDPKVQLDHILGHGPGLPAVTATATPVLPVSDHRALVADLRDPVQHGGQGGGAE